jgi:hypothetical protein
VSRRRSRNVAHAVKAVIENVLIPAFKILLPAVRGTVAGILEVLRGLVRIVSGVLTGDWRKAWEGVKDVVRGTLRGVVSLVKGSARLLLAAAEGTGKAVTKGIMSGLGNLGHLLLAKVKDAIGWVAGKVGGLGSSIGKKLNPFGDGIGKPAGGMLPSGGAFGGSLMGAQSSLRPFAAIGDRFGLRVSSGRRPGSITSSGNVSYHSSGEAIDEAGSAGGMLGYFRYLKSRFGGRLAELIHTPGGMGIKNGRPYRYTGQVAADHYDHVHVAFDTGRPGVGDGLGRRRPGTGDGIGFRGLEDLWYRAGGGAKLAPLMAHVAQAESGGNPQARNPSGASGLWQILGKPFSGNVFNPLTNARMAVWKYRHQGLGAWAASRGTWGRYVGARETYSPGGGSGRKPAKGRSVVRGSGTSGGGQIFRPGAYAVYGNPVDPSDEVTSAQAFARARARGARPANPAAKGYTADQRPPSADTGDTGDPNQALIDAINANTRPRKRRKRPRQLQKAALDAVQSELKANRDFATSVQATDNYQLKKFLADEIGGFVVGRGVTGRAFTAGTGVEHAY